MLSRFEDVGTHVGQAILRLDHRADADGEEESCGGSLTLTGAVKLA